jgi:hypothetical protein
VTELNDKFNRMLLLKHRTTEKRILKLFSPSNVVLKGKKISNNKQSTVNFHFSLEINYEWVFWCITNFTPEVDSKHFSFFFHDGSLSARPLFVICLFIKIALINIAFTQSRKTNEWFIHRNFLSDENYYAIKRFANDVT